ncbi:MAG TPA: hypothetical protein VJ873_02870 [bacterium]|nr:hypothetical protein [bacterium]
MKRKKIVPPRFLDFVTPYFNWIWFALAVGLWGWEQFNHVPRGVPLSWLIFGKGLLLLAEASTLFALARFRGFYFLGMFPLAWLAVSHFQWDICAIPEYRYWAWLVLFLGVEILILVLPNGKKLLLPLVPLWVFLIWLFKFSFLLPLAFVTAPSKRFSNAVWVRWGGPVVGLVLFLGFRGWNYFSPGWAVYFDEWRLTSFYLLLWLVLAISTILFVVLGGLGYCRAIGSGFLKRRGLIAFLILLSLLTLGGAAVLFLLAWGWIYFHPVSDDFLSVFIDHRFFAFLLLGWLGLFAYDSKWKGTFRHILTPVFLLTLGLIFWGGQNLVGLYELEVLQWFLVLAAGYGWEAFRKYMMDPSWHGRLAWFVLGLALFGGVL